MALANLAVEFKLKGASEAQRQVENLGGSFSKLGGTIDKASGMVKSSISTMMGMMSSTYIDRLMSGVWDATKRMAQIPNEMLKSRMEISKSRSELLHAGLGMYDVNQVEKLAKDFTNQYAGITTNAYLQAMYEMQSSIPEASMKTKQKMAESALLTASVTSATNEDMAKLFAKAVHSLRAVGQSEDAIIQRMTDFGGKIKKAVDVGVFRGPDMLEALKQTVPVWIQRGATDSEMVGLNTFLMTQGFDASTSGVYSREMAQRLPKAMAASELANRIYQRTGSEEAVRKSIDNAGKYKKELFKIQSEMDKTGIFTSGPVKMLDNYRQSLDKIPKVLADKLRLKYTHEHLDPGLLAIFGGWENFMRMMKEVEAGNFSTVMAMIGAKAGETSEQFKLLEERIGNLKTTLGSISKSAIGPGMEYFSNSIRDLEESIRNRMPEITGYLRGVWSGFKEAIPQDNPIKKWISELDQMFEGESGFSMFLKGEGMGKKIGERMDPWIRRFTDMASTAKNLAAELKAVANTFASVMDLFYGPGDTSERISRYLGNRAEAFNGPTGPETNLERRIKERFKTKEGETWGTPEASVIGETKKLAEEFPSQPLGFGEQVSLMRELLVKIGVLAEKEPSQQMPSNIGLSGTLRIEGNTGTISANGTPNNTANAMGQ